VIFVGLPENIGTDFGKAVQQELRFIQSGAQIGVLGPQTFDEVEFVR